MATEKLEENRFLEGKTAQGGAGTGALEPAQSGVSLSFEEKGPSSASSASSSPSGSVDPKALEQRVIDEALKKCFDPEIPVDIYELGLVYSVDASPEGVVSVKMTLTAPACPVAGTLPGEVEAKVKAVPGVKDAKVELVWDPPWTADMMSRVAKVMLGM
jgi:FeS assembly SUF system protein